MKINQTCVFVAFVFVLTLTGGALRCLKELNYFHSTHLSAVNCCDCGPQLSSFQFLCHCHQRLVEILILHSLSIIMFSCSTFAQPLLLCTRLRQWNYCKICLQKHTNLHQYLHNDLGLGLVAKFWNLIMSCNFYSNQTHSRGRQRNVVSGSCYYSPSASSLVQQSSSYMEISDNAGGPPVPMDQHKHQQTMMWHQNQYMGDSGIQSSVTTRVSLNLAI